MPVVGKGVMPLPLDPPTISIEAAVRVELPIIVSADDELESTATPQLVAARVTWPVKLRAASTERSSATRQFGASMFTAAAVALAPTLKTLPPKTAPKVSGFCCVICTVAQ
jgi:hypothetical protein